VGIPVVRGSGAAQEMGIQAVCGSGHPTWSWDPVGPEGRGSLLELGSGSVEGRGSQWCVDPVLCSPRGREPSGAEQRLCRTTGLGLGRLVVLLLDCGMEKLSMS
jgi:hypothetical protein